MSSVRQIAREAGVSIATVSRALNNKSAVSPKTREQILEVANRTGYLERFGRKNTSRVGLLYMDQRLFSHHFEAAVLDGAVSRLEEYGHVVSILNSRTKRSSESYMQFFARNGVDAVLIRTTAASRRECIQIAREGIPHVVISERFEGDEVNSIDCDSSADSKRAVDYLVRLGHRRIAFAMHDIADRDHLDRLEGYKAALLENDLQVDVRLIHLQPYTITGGMTVMKLIRSMADAPTAIYFADPMHAVGAMKTAAEMGMRIPDDLSIVGFDDTDVRFSVHPTMTAVCQDAHRLGIEAAQSVYDLVLQQHRGVISKSIPSFFEIHDSTGPPASNSDRGDKPDEPKEGVPA